MTKRASSGGILDLGAIIDTAGKIVHDGLKEKHPEVKGTSERALLSCVQLSPFLVVDVTGAHRKSCQENMYEELDQEVLGSALA